MPELSGLPAPFSIAWLGVVIFAFFGGLASAFIKIDDIDNRLKHPFIAKPLIGMTAGVALAVFINQNAEPPATTLIFWAFIGSLASTPIIAGFLVFISDQRRQERVYNQIKDKYLPWASERDTNPHKGGQDGHQ